MNANMRLGKDSEGTIDFLQLLLGAERIPKTANEMTMMHFRSD